MLKYLSILLISVTVSICFYMASDAFTVPEQQQTVSFRRIGHKLLLVGRDSTSRVLPVKKVSDNTFKIHFEKPFSLNPDTLVSIVKAEEKLGLFPESYIVNVRDYKDNIHYAYSMPLKNGEGPPCLARSLPKARYYITISFTHQSNIAWLSAGMLPLFLVVGWQFYNKKKYTSVNTKNSDKADDYLKIGEVNYYPSLQKLTIKGENISLTAKEARVLTIFAQNINKEVTRERLQKEVWEDEGVIVGRSLDMFISKLRKKFKDEPSIQIINIHGKGYKLIVE